MSRPFRLLGPLHVPVASLAPLPQHLNLPREMQGMRTGVRPQPIQLLISFQKTLGPGCIQPHSLAISLEFAPWPQKTENPKRDPAPPPSPPPSPTMASSKKRPQNGVPGPTPPSPLLGDRLLAQLLGDVPQHGQMGLALTAAQLHLRQLSASGFENGQAPAWTWEEANVYLHLPLFFLFCFSPLD